MPDGSTLPQLPLSFTDLAYVRLHDHLGGCGGVSVAFFDLRQQRLGGVNVLPGDAAPALTNLRVRPVAACHQARRHRRVETLRQESAWIEDPLELARNRDCQHRWSPYWYDAIMRPLSPADVSDIEQDAACIICEPALRRSRPSCSNSRSVASAPDAPIARGCTSAIP